MPRSKVAVLRVRPDHVFDDIDRLHGLAEVDRALTPGATTILKDNISWHFPFPGANTTPWQLEGTVKSLRAQGFADLVCVQNKTVVTDAFKGEDLNGYLPSSGVTASRVATTSKTPTCAGSRSSPSRRCVSWTASFPKASTSPISSSARTSSTCRPSSATST